MRIGSTAAGEHDVLLACCWRQASSIWTIRDNEQGYPQRCQRTPQATAWSRKHSGAYICFCQYLSERSVLPFSLNSTSIAMLPQSVKQALASMKHIYATVFCSIWHLFLSVYLRHYQPNIESVAWRLFCAPLLIGVVALGLLFSKEFPTQQELFGPGLTIFYDWRHKIHLFVDWICCKCSWSWCELSDWLTDCNMYGLNNSMQYNQHHHDCGSELQTTPTY